MPRDLGADGTALGGIQGFKEPPKRLDSMDRHRDIFCRRSKFEVCCVRFFFQLVLLVKRPCLMFDV